MKWRIDINDIFSFKFMCNSNGYCCNNFVNDINNGC